MVRRSWWNTARQHSATWLVRGGGYRRQSGVVPCRRLISEKVDDASDDVMFAHRGRLRPEGLTVSPARRVDLQGNASLPHPANGHFFSINRPRANHPQVAQSCGE
jgi:hypothetical protein